MGCDIHLRAEVRVTDEDGTKWHMVPDPIVDCWMCKGAGIIDPATHKHYRAEWLAEHAYKPCQECCEPSWSSGGKYDEDDEDARPFLNMPGKVYGHWYDDRNYDVFAILANVRNGSGFGGCDTGDGFEYLSDNRGAPIDIAEENRKWFEEGDHSHTWVGLDEIMSVDWTKKITTKRGWVTPDEFIEWRTDGAPSSWCGGVNGNMVRKVPHETMERLIANGEIVKQTTENWSTTHSYYTLVEWRVTYAQTLERFMGRMKDLLKVTGENPARLIMHFDS